MIRTYAKIVGILLFFVGLVGFANLIETVLPTDLFHMAVGILFTYLGFLQRDVEVVRKVVGGMGVLLLVVKGAVILTPLLWGGAPLHGPIEITCLVVGLLSVLAARYSRDGAPPRQGIK